MYKLDNKGQTLIEYVLIVSLITALAIGLVKFFGGYLTDAITKSSCQIASKEYIEGKTPGKGYCKGDEEKILE